MTLEELQAENANLRTQVQTLEAAQERVNKESKSHRLNAESFQRQADDLRTQLEAATKERDALTAAHSTEVEKIKVDLTARATAAETAATEASTKAQQRMLQADLRVAARDAGMVDLDGLKLLDPQALKLGDDGSVQNAAEVLTQMKEAKPYLFGTASTTSTSKPPPQEPGKPVHTSQMKTREERQAAARAVGIETSSIL